MFVCVCVCVCVVGGHFSWWTPSSPEVGGYVCGEDMFVYLCTLLLFQVSFDCVGLSTKKAQKKLRNAETAGMAAH